MIPYLLGEFKINCKTTAEAKRLTNRRASIYHKKMRRHLLSILLIAAISTILYANTLKNGFVYDDNDTIVNNLFIRDFHNLPNLFEKDYFALSREMSYRPTATFTYFIDYAIFGSKPWGFHLTNLLLHAINGILLYTSLTLFLREAFYSKALTISLLFIAHPILTEAVNAISFREDLLAFAFFMATLNLYLILKAKPVSTPRPPVSLLYFLSCLTYCLALLSKEMAATLPLIAVSYEWIYTNKKEKDSKSSIFNRFNLGYIILTFIYFLLRFYYFRNPLETRVPTLDLMERVFTLPWLLVSYLKLILFPINLSVDYFISPVKSLASTLFIIPLILLISLLSITFLMKKRQKEMAFGIIFFIITLAPVYNIIPIVHIMAERYLYLPAAGFAIVAGLTIHMAVESRYLKIRTWYPCIVMLMLILGAFSSVVVKRNAVWGDEYSLWADTVKKQPKSSGAHHSLGRIYHKRGELAKAIKEYNTALDLAPDNSFALNSIGLLYYEGGEYNEAIRAYREAIRFNYYEPVFHFNLGRTYAKQFKYEEAIQEYKKALQLKPDYFDAYIYLEIANRYLKEQKGKISNP